MDWLILVLVTPLIIVVVVLLYGFVGCGAFGVADSKIPAPNLMLEGVDTERIDLSWNNQSPAETKEFKLESRTISTITPHIIPADPGVRPTFSDLVGEGAAFHYAVLAVAHDGTPSDFSTEVPAKTFLKAPSDFIATPVSATEIRLTWTNNSAKATSLKLERSLDGINYPLLDPPPSPHDVMYSNSDPSMMPGTKYYYRLTAQGHDDTFDTFSKTVETSATIILAWKTSFETQINQDGGPYYAGSCLVQRIKARVPGNLASLQESGNWVRITMSSDSLQETHINAVYISRVGPGNPYNSADDIKQVFFSGGDQKVTLSKNLGPIVSDPIRYDLDREQDLIIAFDASPDSTSMYYGEPPGPQLYGKRPQAGGPPVKEASMKIRSDDYEGPEDNRVNCVRKIEVA